MINIKKIENGFSLEGEDECVEVKITCKIYGDPVDDVGELACWASEKPEPDSIENSFLEDGWLLEDFRFSTELGSGAYIADINLQADDKVFRGISVPVYDEYRKDTVWLHVGMTKPPKEKHKHSNPRSVEINTEGVAFEVRL